MNEIKVIENNGQRVLTTVQIAELYGTDSKVISNNFNRNKERYTEGKHYYCLTGDAKRGFVNRHQIEDGSKASNFYLWAEKGALLHAKSLNTDKAWEVYDYLVENYFEVKDQRLTGMKLIATAVVEAQALLKEKDNKICMLETSIAVKDQQISELKPKASYYDVVLNCPDLLSTTKIAKDYGKSAVWLNSYLHDKKIQYKQGGVWLLYQNYAQCGYTSTKTHNYNGDDGIQHAKVHTYWTQKGRLFIYETLKSDGILPLVEYKQSAQRQKGKIEMNEIVINNQNVLVKEYEGKRVVTFKDIDMVHGRPEGTARKRFNDNKKHFIEGEDYYRIQPSEIRTVGITSPNRYLFLFHQL